MFIASRAIEKANILYRKRFTRILNPGGLLCLFGLDWVCDPREQIMFFGIVSLEPGVFSISNRVCFWTGSV